MIPCLQLIMPLVQQYYYQPTAHHFPLETQWFPSWNTMIPFLKPNDSLLETQWFPSWNTINSLLEPNDSPHSSHDHLLQRCLTDLAVVGWAPGAQHGSDGGPGHDGGPHVRLLAHQRWRGNRGGETETDREIVKITGKRKSGFWYKFG